MRVHGVTDGPLFPDRGSSGARAWRLVRGIVIEFVAFVLVTVLFPLLIVIAALVDLALWVRSRKPWMGWRLVAMAWWFLFAEVRVLLVLLGMKILSPRDSPRRRRWLYTMRIHWMRSHIGGIRVLFGVGFEVEGIEHAGPGPIVMFMRHASIIDNALPSYTVGREYGMGLRFVVKDELKFLPIIDIGGRWVPTFFARRGSSDSEGEIAHVRTLGRDLAESREGIMVYPEGTRGTAAKRARAKEVIAERQPELSPLADPLRHLLPPRLGGPLAVLETTPGIDVVFCGHVGFDGLRSIGDIWRGSLVGTTIRVRFWRVPAAEVPRDGDHDERVRWLYARWQAMDDWIDANLEASGAPAVSPVPA